jgi:hypothetical protein
VKCKSCGREFHNCSSCDYEECANRGFCSDRCMKSSEEYKTAVAVSAKIENFLHSCLTSEELKIYRRWDAYICYNLIKFEELTDE